jgi:hypothetical protein
MTDQNLRRSALRKLQQALNHKPEGEEHLPLRVQEERQAGRWRLMKNLRDSIVAEGAEELMRRFSKQTVLESDLRFDQGKWIAFVRVQCADGKRMTLEEPLMEFPSEMMIAQVALVS